MGRLEILHDGAQRFEQVVSHGVQQTRKTVKDVLRGYSEEELQIARGLVDGSLPITEKDRNDYKKRQAEILSTLLIPGPSQALMDPAGFLRTEDFRQYNQRLQELRDLKPEEVDERIKREAQELSKRAERQSIH